MPRYRFSWSNLSPRVLAGLANGLRLDGDPAEALRRQYGARPKANFIQSSWPWIIDVWLTNDPRARQFLAEELRKIGLGKSNMPSRGKQAQLDYLRTCRNAPTLREYVLAAFLASGETTQLAAPPVRDVPAELSPEEVPAPAPRTAGASEQSGRTAQATTDPDLNAFVEAVLMKAFNLKEIHRDGDGDIPIPRGSSVLFIRPHEADSPFLNVFAPLLRNFQMSSAVYEAVNAINDQLSLAKVVVDRDGSLITLEAQLLIDTLSPAELMFAVDLVSAAADHFDTLLQKRFGGELLLQDDADDSIEV